MPKIDFILHNHTEAAMAQRVLVFLRPDRLQDQTFFHAWQTLSPPPRGGSHSFSFEGVIEVAAAEDHPQGSRSSRLPIRPGQSLVAGKRNGQGPQLNPASGQDQQGGPSRVINSERQSLRVIWYCDGRPFLRQTVAGGCAAELQLLPGFLFHIVEPSRDGLYRPSEVLRVPEYLPAEETQLVDVIWYRLGDSDGLSFDPPSADPGASDAPSPQPDSVSADEN